MSDITIEQVKEFLGKLTVVEIAGLVKDLEEDWGVSAAAPVAMVAGGAAAGGAAEEVAEPTEFNVTLTGFGSQKLQVIKEVRGITGLGLKEAKGLVDGVPQPLKEGVSKDEAADLKKQIEGAGGTVDIAPV
jgi:large subunit ribosomal protein L7/L12